MRLLEAATDAFINLASWNVSKPEPVKVEPVKQPRDALGRFMAVAR